MPRKTSRSGLSRYAARMASMRPRPDAAENLGLGHHRVEALVRLQ